MPKKTVLISGFALLGLVALASLGGVLMPCDDCCEPGEESGCLDCCCAKVVCVVFSALSGEQFLALHDRIDPVPQGAPPADFVHSLDRPPRTSLL